MTEIIPRLNGKAWSVRAIKHTAQKGPDGAIRPCRPFYRVWIDVYYWYPEPERSLVSSYADVPSDDSPASVSMAATMAIDSLCELLGINNVQK